MKKEKEYRMVQLIQQIKGQIRVAEQMSNFSKDFQVYETVLGF